MPGWLSRAAACASRSTRRPDFAVGLDRLDRDGPLEAAVPGLVDDAEAAAADAALDQEAVENEGTDQSSSPSSRRNSASSCDILPCFLEDSEFASRPGRRPRPPRRPERQQILLRRGLALGAGLLILILIVLGVRGCLNARKHRALSDYARNVTQIVDETDQTSKSFFGKLSDPGSLSVTEFVAEVNADRSAMDNYAARIDGLDTPGDMGSAQNALELIYELRGSAMTEIADKMSTALGDVGAEKATDAIANQMGKLAASDVLYASVARPEIDGVLADNGIEGDDVPKSVFVPDGTKWLDESAVSAALGSVSGGDRRGDPGRARPGPDRDQHQRDRTDAGIDHRGQRRRNAGSRSRGSEPGRIDRERRDRLGHRQRQHPERDISSIEAGAKKRWRSR